MWGIDLETSSKRMRAYQSEVCVRLHRKVGYPYSVTGLSDGRTLALNFGDELSAGATLRQAGVKTRDSESNRCPGGVNEVPNGL